MKSRGRSAVPYPLAILSLALAISGCDGALGPEDEPAEAELNMVNLAQNAVVDSIVVNGQRTTTEPHQFTGGRGDHVEPGEARVVFHFAGSSRSGSATVAGGDYVGVFLLEGPADAHVRVTPHPGGAGSANVLVMNETPGTTIQVELTSGSEGQNHALTLAYGESELLEMSATLTYLLSATIDEYGDGVMTMEEEFQAGDRFLILLPPLPQMEGERLFYWKG